MSREIKFRAWDQFKKKMYTFDELDYADQNNDINFYTLIKGQYPEVKAMQSIGRKDKNGKDIYEGDIAQTIYNGQKSRYEVIYHNCSFWFISESGTRYRADQVYWGSMEVVDHIYSSGTKRSRKFEDDDLDKFRHHEEFPY